VGVAGLWLATMSALAQTVSVELKNGDRITGRIVSETTDRVVLSNSFAREIAIPLAEISKRTALAAVTNTNATAVAAIATNTPAKTNAVALAKAVAATNSIFTSPALKNWHGDIQAGVDLTFSERNRQVYNAKAKLTYAKDRFKTVFDYDMTYGRTEVNETTTIGTNTITRQTTKTDANRMNGAIKTDFDLTKKWYVYNLVGAGYDEIRKIDLRYEVGPGLGYHLIQRTNFFMNLEVGATYQKEERADGSEVSRFFGRAAEMATWKITPRLTWDEKLEYMPQIDDPAQFRMRFETNFRYAMLQNVFFNLSLIDIYDSQPANGVTPNDLQLRSSVGVKF
jgi:putative salt-induced outer membrane protein YdiY